MIKTKSPAPEQLRLLRNAPVRFDIRLTTATPPKIGVLIRLGQPCAVLIGLDLPRTSFRLHILDVLHSQWISVHLHSTSDRERTDRQHTCTLTNVVPSIIHQVIYSDLVYLLCRTCICLYSRVLMTVIYVHTYKNQYKYTGVPRHFMRGVYASFPCWRSRGSNGL